MTPHLWYAIFPSSIKDLKLLFFIQPGERILIFRKLSLLEILDIAERIKSVEKRATNVMNLRERFRIIGQDGQEVAPSQGCLDAINDAVMELEEKIGGEAITVDFEFRKIRHTYKRQEKRSFIPRIQALQQGAT